MNPVSGKRERIFVDLRAVYPTPDEPGTELSFEEIWAANRGWLDREWEDEAAEAPAPITDENAFPGRETVHHDVVRLDENGAPIYHRETKARRKKVIEVNETQISQSKALSRLTSTCI